MGLPPRLLGLDHSDNKPSLGPERADREPPRDIGESGMIEHGMPQLLPRPLPISDNVAASAALLARLTARPPFPFPAPGGLPNFLNNGKSFPGMPPMLASLPQFPDLRARLLGLQFPQRQESQTQFSPPGFLGGFNFNRDGSDSPIDGKQENTSTSLRILCMF